MEDFGRAVRRRLHGLQKLSYSFTNLPLEHLLSMPAHVLRSGTKSAAFGKPQ